MRALLFVLLLLPTLTSAKTAEACYQVRGRLSYWNGAPSTRIWVVGTHRLLGVRDEDAELPANVNKLLTGHFGDEVYGDYLVCPFTLYRAGQMQIVQVKSATHLVYRHGHD